MDAAIHFPSFWNFCFIHGVSIPLLYTGYEYFVFLVHKQVTSWGSQQPNPDLLNSIWFLEFPCCHEQGFHLPSFLNISVIFRVSIFPSTLVSHIVIHILCHKQGMRTSHFFWHKHSNRLKIPTQPWIPPKFLWSTAPPHWGLLSILWLQVGYNKLLSVTVHEIVIMTFYCLV